MNKKRYQIIILSIVMLGTCLFLGQTLMQAYAAQQSAVTAAPASTAFTYQGRLDDGGAPASGSYDFTFTLHDTAAGATQIGSAIGQTLVVTDGLFTTALDFGTDAWTGEVRYLQISIFDPVASTNTVLTPRQEIGTVPYASHALSVTSMKNIINVSAVGGDFTTIHDAMASITDATAVNPYLIRIGPGVYQSTATINVKPYVSLQGSGEGVTIIRSFGGTTIYSATVRVAGTTPTTISHLTIESSGAERPYATAFLADTTNTADILLSHVSLNAIKATSTNIAIFNNNASPTLEHIQAFTAGNGDNWTIFNNGSSPKMTDISASAANGLQNRAIYNSTSSPQMKLITASATGGADNIGILNADSTGVLLDSAHVSISGGSTANTALYHSGATTSVVLQGVIATAVDADSAVLVNAGGATIVRGSTFTGSAISINGISGSVLVHASELHGKEVGTVTCHDSIGDGGSALARNCQELPSFASTDWDEIDDIPADLSDGEIDWDEINNVPTGLDPANIIWVAKSGGDFTTLEAALASVTDATSANKYLIRIAPGIYTLSSQIVLKSWVDIEGSGQGMTLIRGYGGTTCAAGATVYIGAVVAQVRNLTIQSAGTGQSYACAVYSYDTPEHTIMRHVKITASSASYNYGVVLEEPNSTAANSAPKMEHLEITVTGGLDPYGIRFLTSYAELRDSTLKVGQSVNNRAIYAGTGSYPSIYDTSIEVFDAGTGYNGGIWFDSSGGVIKDVNIYIETAFNTPYGSYGIWLNNGYYNTLLNQIYIIGGDSTGATSTGVYVSDSIVSISNSRIDGQYDDGIEIQGSGRVNADNIFVETGLQGIHVGNGDIEIQDSHIDADDALKVDSSGGAEIANSLLDGNLLGTGTYSCFNNYDHNYTAQACP